MATSDDPLRRIPPNDVKAEQGLLGSILIDNAALLKASEVLEAQDFYREINRLIFAAMLELSERMEPIDAITLTNELRLRGQLEQIGGEPYVFELAAAQFTSQYARHYARIIKRHATARKLISMSTGWASAMFDGGDLDETIAVAEYELMQIAHNGQLSAQPVSVNELSTTLWRIEHGELSGIATGFTQIDRLTGGFYRGDLDILAAPPGEGKTTLALNIASNLARRNERVLYLSLEMKGAALLARELGGRAGVDLSQVRFRGLHEDEQYQLREANKIIEQLIAERMLDIRYVPGLTPGRMRMLARSASMQSKLSLVIVDHIQLSQSDKQLKTREQEIARFSLAMKTLAGELDVAVLGLSQFNREYTRRTSGIPGKGDLRDSGAIEQDADVIFILYPDRSKHAPSDRYIVKVDKQRNGACMFLKLRYEKQLFRFSEEYAEEISDG